MTFPSPTMTQEAKDSRSYGRDMPFRTRQSPRPWAGLISQGGHQFSISSMLQPVPRATCPQEDVAWSGDRDRQAHAWLVSQRAVPPPHTEYLGITYFEDSNADRSSALGLRLNRQNKMKKNKHPL